MEIAFVWRDILVLSLRVQLNDLSCGHIGAIELNPADSCCRLALVRNWLGKKDVVDGGGSRSP